MALFDWNGNGENDSVDNFIEYWVFTNYANNSSSNSHSSSKWWKIVLASLIAGICPILGGIIIVLILLFD